MLNIVLYQPEMPANVGNIIRTAVALNAKLHIIGPIVFSLDEKSLKRAGLDYISSSDLHYYASLEDFNKEHHESNFVYVTRYSKNIYSEYKYGRYDENIFCVFGNESHGLPLTLLKDNVDKTVRIPMVANARSLNLANCVAIVSYEIMRQQGFFNLATSEVIKGEDFL